MLGEIKGIISGQIVYNHIACNNEQICHFQTTKTKNRWTVFQSVENTSKPGPYALHLLDVDWALLNFRLFLKLGPPSRFGAQDKSPPLPSLPHGDPDYECLYMVTFFSCQFCVFQSSFDTWFTQQSYLLFLFQANLKNTCKVLLGN